MSIPFIGVGNADSIIHCEFIFRPSPGFHSRKSTDWPMFACCHTFLSKFALQLTQISWKQQSSHRTAWHIFYFAFSAQISRVIKIIRESMKILHTRSQETAVFEMFICDINFSVRYIWRWEMLSFFFISMRGEQSKHEAYWQRELIATVNTVFYDRSTQHNVKRRLNLLLLTVCATFSANNLLDLFSYLFQVGTNNSASGWCTSSGLLQIYHRNSLN